MKNKGTIVFLAIIMFFIGIVAGVGGITYIMLPYNEELVETAEVYYSKADDNIELSIADGVQPVQIGDVAVHFVELGNKFAGDCTYIKVGTSEGDIDILIDCGSKTNSIPTVSNYLNQYVGEDKTLEYVIVTHAHEDHYAGFATSDKIDGIFDLYECENIITFSNTNQRTSEDFIKTKVSTTEEISELGITSYANTANKPVSKMYANFNQKLTDEKNAGANHLTAKQVMEQYTNGIIMLEDFDDNDSSNDITLQVLNNHYYTNKADSDNEYSVCVMLNQGDNNFLFTGDLEKDGEEHLVELNNLPQVEAYKAGHHGSKTSSSMTLLNAIKSNNYDEMIVCVCCCAGSKEYTKTEANQFPTKEFINNISQFTTKVFVTSLCIDYDNDEFTSFNGNIVIMAKREELEINVYCSNDTTRLKDSDWFKNNRLEMCKQPEKNKQVLHTNWYS